MINKVLFDVESTFRIPVTHEASHMDLTEFYDPSRRQYDGNKLLQYLNSIHRDENIRTIGLFRVDLFIPILTFIFGQAVFKGNSGVVSIYRLRNEQYGMAQDDDLLLDRFRKVVIHELGHTFGLVHCYVPSCVMRSTTYVEDIDQKKYHFCNRCLEQLNTYLDHLSS